MFPNLLQHQITLRNLGKLSPHEHAHSKATSTPCTHESSEDTFRFSQKRPICSHCQKEGHTPKNRLLRLQKIEDIARHTTINNAHFYSRMDCRLRIREGNGIQCPTGMTVPSLSIPPQRPSQCIEDIFNRFFFFSKNARFYAGAMKSLHFITSSVPFSLQNCKQSF